MLRGGAFKPRSSPYAFQGLGQEGLDILVAAREETGLPIVTELMDARHVEAVVEAATSSRSARGTCRTSRSSRRSAGRRSRCSLKRGPASSIEELLMAAEYIVREGNSQVLCERGIRTFERATRFTLDIGAVPVLKEETHLPVVVDPSHAAGRRDLVAPLARAAVAAGADGIIVEVHPEPDQALSTPRSRSRPTTSPPSRRDSGPRLAHGPCNRIAMRVAVVGTGLIGASIGLAARETGHEVVGWDADPEALEVARERVPWTTPGRWRRRYVTPISPSWPLRSPRSRARSRPCSVWAVGHGDRRRIDEGRGLRRRVRPAQIRGRTRRGLGGARPRERERRPAAATWFLTPVAETEPERYRALHGFVASLGAIPIAVDPRAHDRLVALTSHLPHALANVLLNHAGSLRVDGHEPLTAAGGSLRDMTRVGGANPRIWVDIFRENADELRAALAEHRRRVEARARPRDPRRRLPRPLDRRGGRQPAACWPRHIPTQASCSGSGCTFPTGRESCPGSRRRSGPRRSTSRTSSSSTCRRSGAGH